MEIGTRRRPSRLASTLLMLLFVLLAGTTLIVAKYVAQRSHAVQLRQQLIYELNSKGQFVRAREKLPAPWPNVFGATYFSRIELVGSRVSQAKLAEVRRMFPEAIVSLRE